MAGLRLPAVPAARWRQGSCLCLPESQTVQPFLTSFQVTVQSPRVFVRHVAGWPALPASVGTAEQWLRRPWRKAAGCWVLQPALAPDRPQCKKGFKGVDAGSAF